MAADAAPTSTDVSLFPTSRSTTSSSLAASISRSGPRTAATTPAGTGLAVASISRSTVRSAAATSPVANFSALSSRKELADMGKLADAVEACVEGYFAFRHPYDQYRVVGVALRHCAYCVEALSGCIRSAEI